ncbi:MAG: precorrin-4 C(11)-methyltransferase [Candidatus Schekmanbacteria bacterium]|nr:precorrin-4 C(11)-methyltransferase [Candidatus Schekmanbacteria bacterium]
MKVCFIGAGPGDPELLTIKGRRIIDQAPVIIYAGSLVNPQVLKGHRDDAVIYDSAHLHLEQIFAIYKQAQKDNKDVARVHTGDPSIYGAIAEQIDWLKEQGIDFEVIPGVSSFCAAAAALGKELTIPEITQTVILSRMGGRTPVPEKEELSRLAQHQATLILFLSVPQIDELIDKLLIGGYSSQTPAAIVVKASWPEEKKVLTTIGELKRQVEIMGVKKTALIIIGQALGDNRQRSLLYDAVFSHEYRSKDL